MCIKQSPKIQSWLWPKGCSRKGCGEMEILTLGMWLLGFSAVAGVMYKSLVRIPAEPPTVAVVTFFGKRIKRFKKEGWRWFLFHPFVMGSVLIDVTAKNQDLVPEQVFTPDNAQIEVSVSVTWRPHADKDSPGVLLNFLNSGGESRVMDILEDMIAEAVRELARDEARPPKSWVQATQAQMKNRFAKFISCRLTGEAFPCVGTTDEDIEKENKELEKDEQLKSLRVGNGKIKIESLGISISRINVTNIKPLGSVLEAAQKKAKEIAEAEAEKVETEAVASMIKMYMKELNITAKEAAELVQSERAKIEKKITVFKLDVSEEAERALPHVAKMAASVAAAVKPFIGGKKDGGQKGPQSGGQGPAQG